MGVEREEVITEDELGRLDEELSGEVLVEEVFQNKETMKVRDVDIQEGEVNSCHNGVGRQRGEEGLDNIKEVVSVLDIGREGFDYGLKMGISLF